MKKPLSYQSTEHDSLTTTIMNAFKYSTQTREIPLEILNAANELTVGNEPPKITDFISWLNEFAKSHEIKVKFNLLPNENIDENTFKTVTQNGNSLITKCYNDHYCLVTGIDEANTYLFDPYYLEIDSPEIDDDFKIICDEQNYNRIVHNERFFNSQDKSYSLSNPKECILVEKTS